MKSKPADEPLELRPVKDAPMALLEDGAEFRDVDDDPGFAEFTDSIREHGVLQPIVIRPVGDEFQVVIGRRRKRAADAAGISSIPVIVRDFTDTEAAIVSLVSNIHHKTMNSIERGRAYRALLAAGMTQTALAKKLGVHQPEIAGCLRMLELPQTTQDLVEDGKLSHSHAIQLLKAPPEDRERLTSRIASENLSVKDTLSVVDQEAAQRKQYAERQTADDAGLPDGRGRRATREDVNREFIRQLGRTFGDIAYKALRGEDVAEIANRYQQKCLQFLGDA